VLLVEYLRPARKRHAAQTREESVEEDDDNKPWLTKPGPLIVQRVDGTRLLDTNTLPDMESLSRLRSILLTTLEPQNNNVDEQELFDLLVLHRRNLINLFDVSPPSDDERRELQSGT